MLLELPVVDDPWSRRWRALWPCPLAVRACTRGALSQARTPAPSLEWWSAGAASYGAPPLGRYSTVAGVLEWWRLYAPGKPPGKPLLGRWSAGVVERRSWGAEVVVVLSMRAGAALLDWPAATSG
jgi:hypothetical protein